MKPADETEPLRFCGNRETAPWHSRSCWLVVGILPVAGALRFHDLGGQSLWLDEGLTAFNASLPWGALWGTPTGALPPIFYSLTKVATVFGDSEIALRALSAVFGTATVLVVYHIGRKLGGSFFGAAAAVMLALSGIHIEYSQEARSYAFVTFLFALAVLFAIPFMTSKGDDRDRRRSLYFYAVFAGLSVVTHIVAIYFVFGLATAVLLHRIVTDPAFPNLRAVRLPWPFITANLLIAILWFGILLWMKQTVVSFSSYEHWPFEVAVAYMLGIAGAKYSGGLISTAIIVIALCCLAGLYFLLRQRRSEGFALAVALVVAVPLLVWATGFIRPIFMDRIVLPSIVGFALVIGGLSLTPRRFISVVLLGIYLGVASLNVLGYFVAFKKQDWRGATAFIEAEAAPGSAIIVCLTGAYWPLRYYAESDAMAVFSLAPKSRGMLYKLNEDRLREALSRPPAGNPVSLLEPNHVHNSPWLDAVEQVTALQSFDQIWIVESHCTVHQRDVALSAFQARLTAAGFIPTAERVFRNPRTFHEVTATRYARTKPAKAAEG